MKIITLFIIALFLGVIVLAQAPQSFRYQAVARDNSGNILVNQAVSFRISILSGSVSGTITYSETHTDLSTNSFGLVELEIGKGTPVNGTFSSIEWGSNSYFVQVEMDPAGGKSYQELSASQLLSVPYALYAKDVQNGTKPYGASGNVQFNNTGAFGGDENLSWDNTNKRLGIGITYPEAMLHVNNWNNTRQIALNDWSDISASTAGYGLFASNAYLSNGKNTLHFSNTHASLGASGIIFNYPFWHTASIFVNDSASGSLKGQAFTPNVIASFKSGEVNVNNNKITNVANPVNGLDAVNKAYVDAIKEIIYSELLDAGLNGILKDVDNNTYKTIKIGSQVWMAENLKTTKYKDGTAIPLVTDNTAWEILTTPGYCWYNNDQATYGNTYGALYNWYTVNMEKLCPTGWHVPSDAEWTTLTTFLGGESVAGGKMKEAGTTHWLSPNTGATNESGFSALPGGGRDGIGSFYSIGSYSGFWWSSNEGSTGNAWLRNLHYSDSYILRYNDGKVLGYSVRCVRD